MTTNQIAYRQLLETSRSNRANEGIRSESNRISKMAARAKIADAVFSAIGSIGKLGFEAGRTASGIKTLR